MNKQWMKDPLRYAMEARLSGKKRFALGAVLTLVFLLAAVKLCAAMEGAALPAVALDVPLVVDAGQGASWAEAH